jgi:hypothetical protein
VSTPRRWYACSRAGPTRLSGSAARSPTRRRGWTRTWSPPCVRGTTPTTPGSPRTTTGETPTSRPGTITPVRDWLGASPNRSVPTSRSSTTSVMPLDEYERPVRRRSGGRFRFPGDGRARADRVHRAPRGRGARPDGWRQPLLERGPVIPRQRRRSSMKWASTWIDRIRVRPGRTVGLRSPHDGRSPRFAQGSAAACSTGRSLEIVPFSPHR